ncbi:MAG: zf-HC2 domain-containing protein [Hyphomonadaceae bacterium]
MSVSDEKLIAFVDGELDGAERAEVEAALAADATLAARAEAQRKLRTRLSAAFDGALDEPVPERLRAATEAAPRAADVASMADRRAAKTRPQWSFREWGAMAASLVGGLVIGLGAMNANAPMIAPGDDGLVARGQLARALDTQLASDEAGAVRIGLSFRDQNGAYCRTFDARGTAGLACNQQPLAGRAHGRKREHRRSAYGERTGGEKCWRRWTNASRANRWMPTAKPKRAKRAGTEQPCPGREAIREPSMGSARNVGHGSRLSASLRPGSVEH